MSPRRRVIAWLHRFSLSGRLRTDRAYDSRQVTDLLSRAHTCVWALGRLVALLSRIRLFPDRLSGFYFGGGGPCTALSPGLRGGGLESQFGWGPGHPGQESDGLVLLVPGVQAGRVFRGTQLGALIRESPGNPVRLVYGLAS